MIVFLIPTYNEKENLALLAERLKSFETSEEKFYVFSDDGSSDGTKLEIEKQFEGTEFKIVGDGKNYGPGNAFNVGFEWILNQEWEKQTIVVSMEADNTSDIAVLPQMLGNIHLGFDMVLASVYAQGGGFEKTSWYRKLLSFVANMFFRLFFNVQVLTISSFYRAYSLELLQNIKKEYGVLIKEKGFLCMLELLLRAVRIDSKMIEIPMKLNSTIRVGGVKNENFQNDKRISSVLF